jgi:hypothetical protein
MQITAPFGSEDDRLTTLLKLDTVVVQLVDPPPPPEDAVTTVVGDELAGLADPPALLAVTTERIV